MRPKTKYFHPKEWLIGEGSKVSCSRDRGTPISWGGRHKTHPVDSRDPVITGETNTDSPCTSVDISVWVDLLGLCHYRYQVTTETSYRNVSGQLHQTEIVVPLDV